MKHDLIGAAREDEEKNRRFLHITPNEGIMSETARQFLSWQLTDRYYFGKSQDGVIDFGAFTALGYSNVDALVSEAEGALKEMIGASVVNLACLSGIHAMISVLSAATDPGDIVITLSHANGGHFATKGILERIGRKQVDAIFDSKTKMLDAKKTATLFHEVHATAIYIDISYYIDTVDIAALRHYLGEDAVIIFDASHTLGLMLGGKLRSPLLDGADIVCANTHKTLPGPQKGLIAFREEKSGHKINSVISSSFYSSQHTTSLLALAVTILEMKEFGKEYSEQIIKNANALGKAFEELGHTVRRTHDGMYSHTHQVHVITERLGHYRDLYDRLNRSSIAAAFDDGYIMEGGAFIRFGVQELTRRGMTESEMKEVAQLVHRALQGENVRRNAEELKKRFLTVQYSFDQSKDY